MRGRYWFGFGPGAWGGRTRGRRQWFEAGDMKYVILKLLKDKPRHGYEVMKELEERMHGCYSPSPGTVYPTLQWLEDEGLVKGKDVDGKKVYEITESGLAFLEDHRDVVDDIFDRVRDAIERTVGGTMVEVNRAMKDLARSVYRTGWRSDDVTRQKVADIIKAAVAEIDGLTRTSSRDAAS